MKNNSVTNITSPGLSLTQKVLLIGLILLPFFFWPWAKVPFEVPKVWVTLFWIEAVIACYFVTKPVITVSRLRQKLLWPAVVLICLITLSSFWGVSPLKSWLGNYYRADGIIVFLHLFGLSLVVAFEAKATFWQKLVYYLPIGTGVLSGVTIASYLTRFWISHTWTVAQKFGGSFGQPNYLAGYLAVTAPITVAKLLTAQNKTTKVASWLILFLTILAGVLTQSKGGMLMLGLAIIGSFLLFTRKTPKLGLWLKISLGSMILAAVLAGSVLGQVQHQKPFSAESRERVFHKLGLAILERPLQGWGWANVDKAFAATVWPMPILYDVYVDKAHSVVLELLVTIGLLGLSCYLFLVFQMVKTTWKQAVLPNQVGQLKVLPFQNWPVLTLVLLSIYLVHSQMNVISISEELYFWIILGFCLQIPTQKIQFKHFRKGLETHSKHAGQKMVK